MSSEAKSGKGKPPLARFQYGGVSASIFVNEGERPDGSRFQVPKTVLQRTCVDGKGQYRASSTFDVNDLPRAILALTRAYEFCLGAGGRPDADDDQASADSIASQ